MNPDGIITDLITSDAPLPEEQPQENGKKKRQVSEKQLKALAEGRKKR